MNTSIFVLNVDGRSVDPAAFEMHFQDEAFPGGQEYRFVISDADVIQEAISRFGYGFCKGIDRDLGSSFLSILRSLVSFKCGRKAARFWGNTITSIETNDTSCVICGQCSS